MINLEQSTQFQIVDLSIVTKTGKSIDVRNVYEEINIFDSIFTPYISGKLVLLDSVGILRNVIFDGSEVLNVTIGKDRDNILFSKSFRIYKLTDRRNINQTTESFVLHFISDEYINSSQIKVNQSYVGTYTDIIGKMLGQYLSVKEMNVSQTIGIKKIVIPNMSPIDAAEWIAKRSVDKKNVPNFLFFQNNIGYNFVSLSDIIKVPEIASLNYKIKNVDDESTGAGQEILGVMDMKVMSQYNFLDNTKSGVFAGSFIGFDPITRTYVTKNVSFLDHYSRNDHHDTIPNVPVVENKQRKTNVEMYSARKVLYSFETYRDQSQYIKRHSPNSISTQDNKIDYLFERKAIFKNLLNKRIRLVLPGNFNITSGMNVFLNSIDRSNTSEDNRDRTIYGKHMVIASRHIIKHDRHEVVFEVVSDSANQEAIYSSSNQQLRALS